MSESTLEYVLDGLHTIRRASSDLLHAVTRDLQNEGDLVDAIRRVYEAAWSAMEAAERERKA